MIVMDKNPDTVCDGPQQCREALSCFLRDGREARGLTLEDIARVTRIPARSLESLERGELDKLPADVFARGFVRAYAQCARLDEDEAMRLYVACGLEPGPVAEPDAPAKLTPHEAQGREKARHFVGLFERRPAKEPEPASSASHESIDVSPVPMSFANRDDGTRRGGLTLAVIILVIVATLTMSYLLREPASSGDGLTRVDSSTFVV